MSDGRSDNRFERHPVLTWVFIVSVVTVMFELVLIVVDLEIVRFAADSRKIYQYHEHWYTDFEANTSTTMRLSDSEKGFYVNFLVTVNELGFRWHDRVMDHPLPDPSVKPIIHTIGDSFTMGWGVNYDSSYPTKLQELFDPGGTVLNLGLNGYGTIGATGKSLILTENYPPSAVVYLATENDYTDDKMALRHAARPLILRALLDQVNALRKHTRLANVWYAVRWWLFYRSNRVPTGTPWLDPHGVTISQLELNGSSNPEIGSASKVALRSFMDELQRQGVPLFVIGHGDGPVVADIARYAKEHGVQSYLIDFPEALRQRRDGHLNGEGNARLAEYVYELLLANGIGKSSQEVMVSE